MPLHRGGRRDPHRRRGHYRLLGGRALVVAHVARGAVRRSHDPVVEQCGGLDHLAARPGDGSGEHHLWHAELEAGRFAQSEIVVARHRLPEHLRDHLRRAMDSGRVVLGPPRLRPDGLAKLLEEAQLVALLRRQRCDGAHVPCLELGDRQHAQEGGPALPLARVHGALALVAGALEQLPDAGHPVGAGGRSFAVQLEPARVSGP
mmetsp:Transcript_115018/g.321442  ORF Transcript_115018/g.321442 Transcript_115018/m.321442 type:complete len:204 (+) Transcript_115018:991-1602(+)